MEHPIIELTTLTHNINHSLILRRQARIKSSKLPPDFFELPSPSRPSSILRQIGTDLSNRDIMTPSFQTRSRYPQTNSTIQGERKVQTARASLQKADRDHDHSTLFTRVLPSNRRMHSLFRKHSLEAKCSLSTSIDEKHLRLPKILNKALIKHF